MSSKKNTKPVKEKLKAAKKKEKVKKDIPKIDGEVRTFSQIMEQMINLIKSGDFDLKEFWKILRPFAEKVKTCVEGKQETLEAPHRKYAFQPKV